jgi:hypothetical protein
VRVPGTDLKSKSVEPFSILAPATSIIQDSLALVQKTVPQCLASGHGNISSTNRCSVPCRIPVTRP